MCLCLRMMILGPFLALTTSAETVDDFAVVHEVGRVALVEHRLLASVEADLIDPSDDRRCFVGFAHLAIVSLHPQAGEGTGELPE